MGASWEKKSCELWNLIEKHRFITPELLEKLKKNFDVEKKKKINLFASEKLEKRVEKREIFSCSRVEFFVFKFKRASKTTTTTSTQRYFEGALKWAELWKAKKVSGKLSKQENFSFFLLFMFFFAHCLFFVSCWTWKFCFFVSARTSPVALDPPQQKGVKIIFYYPQNRLLNILKITIFHLLVFIHNFSCFLFLRLCRWPRQSYFEGFLINKKKSGEWKIGILLYCPSPYRIKNPFFAAAMGIHSLKCRFVENCFAHEKWANTRNNLICNNEGIFVSR